MQPQVKVVGGSLHKAQPSGSLHKAQPPGGSLQEAHPLGGSLDKAQAAFTQAAPAQAGQGSLIGGGAPAGNHHRKGPAQNGMSKGMPSEGMVLIAGESKGKGDGWKEQGKKFQSISSL
eukprot:s2501_g13.t1